MIYDWRTAETRRLMGSVRCIDADTGEVVDAVRRYDTDTLEVERYIREDGRFVREWDEASRRMVAKVVREKRRLRFEPLDADAPVIAPKA